MINWIEYPKNKPDKNEKYYLVTLQINTIKTVKTAIWLGDDINEFCSEDESEHTCINDWVIAYAEVPEPY